MPRFFSFIHIPELVRILARVNIVKAGKEEVVGVWKRKLVKRYSPPTTSIFPAAAALLGTRTPACGVGGESGAKQPRWALVYLKH